MLDERLVIQLTKLGLTYSQAKVFLTLQILGKSNIKSISNVAKLDRANLYRTMSQLQEIGLVDLFLGKPNLYSSLSIDDALEVLLRRKKEKFELFLKITEEVRKIGSNYRQKVEVKDNFFEITAAKQGQIVTLKKVFLSAKKTHDGVITCFNYIRAMLNSEIRCIFEKSMSKGVNFRYLIYCSSKEEKLEALRLNNKYLSAYSGSMKVRFLDSLPEVIFAIVDRKEVLMHTQPPPNWSGSPCLHSTNICLISVIQKYFDTLWEQTAIVNNPEKGYQKSYKEIENENKIK